MKKFLLFAAFAVFVFTDGYSQEIRFGAKAGVNFASIVGDETEDVDGRTSFHIGGLVEIPITEKFAIQPELLFSSQGAKAEYSDSFEGIEVNYEESLKLDYINIPVMAKYYIIEGLSVEAGPQIGFLVSANAEYEISGGGMSDSDEEDVKDFFKSIDIGFGIGASYRLPMGVFFSARYAGGFTDINDDIETDFGDIDIDDFSQRNSVIQLSVGYSF
ncbi:porin family protein [Aequorivita sp. SDUM287046]|uniref:Porin family protein n=1 Tax=Aequorivita aurantiaca TaxID=3053356 RepID=A0ABT8DDS1_9FLAO|nr:porin family protein [Aequorivita aurantiaca]MDN3723422.1 porin family protein [Aequorivita aurantiaca]